MHLKKILQNLYKEVMHTKRLETLICLASSVFKAKNITLTELGRAIELPIQERSGIRRADRFLGNEKLINELPAIYAATAKLLIGSKLRPIILVDWSKLPNSEYCLLRASLAKEGRAQTLYEEIHHKKFEGNAKIHRKFLNHLGDCLPPGCCPIVVTDAGFQNPWFQDVLHKEWDYVGRVRASGNKKYCTEHNGRWESVTQLFNAATQTPKALGKIILAKTNSLKTEVYIVKEKSKGRHSLRKSGEKRQGRIHREQAKSAKEPLLVASSLEKSSNIAKKVIKIYKLRMQIEQNFRDMKSQKYGFGLREAKTRYPNRLKIYLLIIMIATFWAWIVGWVVETKKLHWQFQANSTKSKRVLSFFYLGCRAIKKNIIIYYEDIIKALNYLGDLKYV